MKKTFKLTNPVKKVERVADDIKCEVKRYVKRERKKALPENFDYWDFDCRIGATSNDAVKIKVNELSSMIDKVVLEGKEEFYLEILAKSAANK